MTRKQIKEVRPIDLINVRKAKFSDLKFALYNGWKDFCRHPFMSMFFGLIFALIGVTIVTCLFYYRQIWLIVPLVVGFPLIAPFAAAGIYEMSRRYQNKESFTWRDIFSVILRQQKRELGWMAFVVLFIFWFWIYQVRMLLAIFLQWKSFSSPEAFLEIVTSSTSGFAFLGVGTMVGAVIATVLFSITVIAMPLLLDREIDFISAMLTSIKAVKTSPMVMLGWGVFIAMLMFASMLTGFLGLIITLPVLGHATWHLYERVIEKLDA